MRDRIIKLVALVAAPVIAVALSPLLLALFVGQSLRRLYLRVYWHLKHGRHGRHWLAVYSDGAKWKEHFESSVVPILGHRAVVINTTKSPTWRRSRSLERLAHRCWAGRIEHTPILIRFASPLASVKCVRLHQAYLAQATRGQPGELEAKVQQLRGMASEA